MGTKTLIYLISILLMWGSAFPLVKIALLETSSITLGFLRFLLATPILLFYSYLRDEKGFKTIFLKNSTSLALLGLTGITGYHILQNLGVELTSATSSSIIISSNPIILALLSALILKEKINLTRALGITIGFSGVLTIILSERQGVSVGSSSFTGDMFCLGAALSWAVYSVVGRRLTTHYDPAELAAASMVFGTIFFLPPMYLLEDPHLPSTASAWLAVVALSLGASCLAYDLWNRVLSEVEASRAGVALFLIPVISAVLSVAFLSEPLTPLLLAGMALVLFGIFLAEKSRI